MLVLKSPHRKCAKFNCPYSYSYLDVDTLYSQKYFETEQTGHPDRNYAIEIYDYMQKVYRDIFKRPFKSILELGTGGGEITYQFFKNDIDFIAVEGTANGYDKLLAQGIPAEKILKLNLKKMKSLFV